MIEGIYNVEIAGVADVDGLPEVAPDRILGINLEEV
jgi:hypothetical protein